MKGSVILVLTTWIGSALAFGDTSVPVSPLDAAWQAYEKAARTWRDTNLQRSNFRAHQRHVLGCGPLTEEEVAQYVPLCQSSREVLDAFAAIGTSGALGQIATASFLPRMAQEINGAYLILGMRSTYHGTGDPAFATDIHIFQDWLDDPRLEPSYRDQLQRMYYAICGRYGLAVSTDDWGKPAPRGYRYIPADVLPLFPSLDDLWQVGRQVYDGTVRSCGRDPAVTALILRTFEAARGVSRYVPIDRSILPFAPSPDVGMRLTGYPVTKDDELSAILAARRYVKEFLLSPKSAKFSGSLLHPRGQERVYRFHGNLQGCVEVRGWVESKNVFGVMIRNRYTVILRKIRPKSTIPRLSWEPIAVDFPS